MTPELANKMALTPEKFIEAWQSSTSYKQVADKLSTTESAVSSRGAYYRKKGIPLRKFAARQDQRDWAALKAYAESLLPT